MIYKANFKIDTFQHQCSEQRVIDFRLPLRACAVNTSGVWSMNLRAMKDHKPNDVSIITL